MLELKRRWSQRVRFPWRDGNRAEILVDGDVFFSRMIEQIDRARSTIEFEMYLFESGVVAGQFIRHLSDASRRGVGVRVLLDGFGALGLRQADRDRLLEAGVDLKFYNPLRFAKLLANMTRDHRKLLLVDDGHAFVGGAGITDEFDPPLRPDRRWRETMVLVQGPVVNDWKALFEQAWEDRPRHQLMVPEIPAGDPAGTMRARLAVGGGRLFQGAYRVLIRRINRAQHRIWICTAYFVPSRRFRKVLRAAARRGLDVRLLLPGPETDHPHVRTAGRGFYAALLKDGIRVFEFQSRVLHSKAVICDDWVSIGSSNYDRWNLRWNLEANLEIEDREFCQSTIRMFENDYSGSVEIRLEDWLRRPWRQRLAERFWGWVEYWITRVGGQRWGD